MKLKKRPTKKWMTKKMNQIYTEAMRLQFDDYPHIKERLKTEEARSHREPPL